MTKTKKVNHKIFGFAALFFVAVIVYIKIFLPFPLTPSFLLWLDPGRGEHPVLLERLSKRYPESTSEDFLIKDLRGMNFIINNKRTAFFEKFDLFCRYKWAFSWEYSTGGALKFSRASYVYGCKNMNGHFEYEKGNFYGPPPKTPIVWRSQKLNLPPATAGARPYRE